MARHKIVVVDDTAMFRELEALFLARTGRVITARSGEEGLETIRRERPDAVVTDLQMPGMDGDVLCSIVKSDPELRDTPVIIVTAGEEPGEHARSVRAGADVVIAKPIRRVCLIDAVNRLLRARRCGLKRVSLEAKVRVEASGQETWAKARNLSRGGMFVELERSLAAPASEVRLEFRLPEFPETLMPTARIVWRRDASAAAPRGMGLQFLALDRTSTQRIEEFVYENAAVAAAKPALPHAVGARS